MNKSSITIDLLREVLDHLEYMFFEKSDYNLNIIGIGAKDRNYNGFIAVAYNYKN